MNHPDRFLPLFLEVQMDLRAFIGAMVRDPVTREDIFQEVSMVLWKKFATYDPTRSFGAWARGVAGRKILEDHRLRSRLPEAFPPEIIEAVAAGFEEDRDHASWRERELALTQCLALLPERSAALVADRYQKGHAVEDIATETGMTIDAIYQALSRLRKQLRECVQRRLGLLNG
ncbi:MAG: polymerase factor sigma-70 [Verrucomicrobiaceae bacterium]|nr:polymerase factor sigma-70 [Verrucomicrobiaceae bacterium]